MFRRIVLITFLFLFFITACNRKQRDAYTYNSVGFYYKLLAYENDAQTKLDSAYYKVAMSFRNQKDSVFWDSFNNYGDFFILNSDSVFQKKTLYKALSNFNVGDSGSLLVRVDTFFRQQFNFEKVPYFSANDSVVKINFKIGGYISPEGFVNLQNSLILREKNKINDYFGSALEADRHRDPQGFYWLERPEMSIVDSARTGDRISFYYEGSFLNGRFLENSAGNFEMVLGTPDQVLKGINYVIQRLKIGQTAKIILPSHLAFGEAGSTNGTVPPYTPLVYKIKLIDIKH